MSNTNSHVFQYRWRRIQEGLHHTETMLGPLMVQVPEGAYIYQSGAWYERRKPPGGGARCVTVRIQANEVPKEIRTLCLILN